MHDCIRYWLALRQCIFIMGVFHLNSKQAKNVREINLPVHSHIHKIMLCCTNVFCLSFLQRCCCKEWRLTDKSDSFVYEENVSVDEEMPSDTTRTLRTFICNDVTETILIKCLKDCFQYWLPEGLRVCYCLLKKRQIKFCPKQLICVM